MNNKDGGYRRGRSNKKEAFTIFKPRTRKPNFILTVLMTSIKMLFVLCLVIGMSLGGVLLGIAKAYIETVPPLDLTKFENQAQTSFIYDRNGNLITDFKGIENRVRASADEIPQRLKDAFIAIEDTRFMSHNGVDVKRIVGSFVSNLRGDSLQGGSTITQQLIKQTMLSTEQTYKRKLQEAYLAMQLETKYNKAQILEEYLNVIYLGGSSYGVKVAAQDYFGKELSQLTIRECAMLAGLNRDPYFYNPRANYYTRNKPENTNKRTNKVLDTMYDNGYITREEYDQAVNEQVVILEKSPTANTKLYDHMYYVEYAIYDVVTHMLYMNQLEDNSANRSSMERKLRSSGYHIYTALDPETQTIVEESLANWKKYPATKNKSQSIYKAPNGNGTFTEVVQPQAAAVVFDYHAGEFVAIVGGRQEPTALKQLNRAYQSSMPVGSAIKPLSVYGPAFDRGYSPGTPTFNMPIKIDGWVSSKGYPQNYGGGGYNGMESLRNAMKKSHNTSTAQTLFQYVGIENSVNYLMNLGISKAHINQNGAGLALGSSGITTAEMAVAFGAIANKGTYQQGLAFRRVEDSNGNIVIDAKQNQAKRQVFKPSTAWILIDVLKQCASSSGTGSKSNFDGMTVAGKTGTNSDQIGVTFSGITPYYSASVWIGHDNYKPLTSKATGGSAAAPLFADFMEKIHKAKGLTDKAIIEDSPESLGLIEVKVCDVSGLLPNKNCANDANGYGTSTDWYLKGTQPTVKCNMHTTVELCAESKKLPTDYCPIVENYGVVKIPNGHPLSKISVKTLAPYFSGITVGKKSSGLDVCDIHTKEWFDGYDDELNAMITSANQAIEKANTALAGDLSSSSKKAINKALDKLYTELNYEIPSIDTLRTLIADVNNEVSNAK